MLKWIQKFWSNSSAIMILSVLFFSFGHIAVKWVPHIPFYQLVFLRAAITIALSLPIMLALRVPVKGNSYKNLVLRGAFGTVAVISYFYSLQNMPFASAVTIQYLSPLLTIVLAQFILNEKPTGRQWFLFLVAFVGVFLVKGFDDRIHWTAAVVSLLSVVASAIAYNMVRLLRNSDHELTVVLYFPLVTLPVTAPFALMNWVSPSLRDIGFILMIGVFTQLAQVLMTVAYHREKAADVAIYNNLGVLFALILGYLFFLETFSWTSVMGMILVLISVAMATYRR